MLEILQRRYYPTYFTECRWWYVLQLPSHVKMRSINGWLLLYKSNFPTMIFFSYFPSVFVALICRFFFRNYMGWSRFIRWLTSNFAAGSRIAARVYASTQTFSSLFLVLRNCQWTVSHLFHLQVFLLHCEIFESKVASYVRLRSLAKCSAYITSFVCYFFDYFKRVQEYETQFFSSWIL